MNLAQQAIDKCDSAEQTFVYATMNAQKSEIVSFFDVYSAPHFEFKDGSVIEFVLEYDREVVQCEWFADLNDLVAHGHRWSA